MNHFKLIECPRDAMQGIHQFISTEKKIEYLNLLLNIGFDTLDFGSFVSPKAIPQMGDTAEVLASLDESTTKLLAIVANEKGIKEALKYQRIKYLGFPFSISETFQRRNTNSSISASLNTVESLIEQCSVHNKEAVIYLSMAFGNPYGDDWSTDLIGHWSHELAQRGAKIIALSDTIGVGQPDSITQVYRSVSNDFPELEIGLHLHTTLENVQPNLEAAYLAGCRRIDSALRGYGGCPMAADKLTGNMPTETVISYLDAKEIDLGLNLEVLDKALLYSDKIFNA